MEKKISGHEQGTGPNAELPLPIDEEADRLKLEGALEMASATAGHLDRPLTTITLLLDLLIEEMDPDDPRLEALRRISEQVFKIGEFTRRITCLWKYETKESRSGGRVLDLDKSSAPCAVKGRILYGGEQWALPKRSRRY